MTTALRAVPLNLPKPLGPRLLHYVLVKLSTTSQQQQLPVIPMVSMDEVLLKLFDAKKHTWGVSKETMRKHIVTVCSDDNNGHCHQVVITSSNQPDTVQALRACKVIGNTAPSVRLLSHACLVKVMERRGVPGSILAVVRSVDPQRHGSRVSPTLSAKSHGGSTGARAGPSAAAAPPPALSPNEVARMQHSAKMKQAWTELTNKLKDAGKQQQQKLAGKAVQATRVLSAPNPPSLAQLLQLQRRVTGDPLLHTAASSVRAPANQQTRQAITSPAGQLRLPTSNRVGEPSSSRGDEGKGHVLRAQGSFEGEEEEELEEEEGEGGEGGAEGGGWMGLQNATEGGHPGAGDMEGRDDQDEEEVETEAEWEGDSDTTDEDDASAKGAGPDGDEMEAMLNDAFASEARRARLAASHLPIRLMDRDAPGAADAHWPSRWLAPKARFALSEEQLPDQLIEQVKLFLDTAADKGVNMLRAGVYTRAQSVATLSRTKADMLRFMGFLRNVLDWPISQLHLSAYSNLNTFGDFISFMDARQVKSEELALQCNLAMRINLFLSNLLLRTGAAGDGLQDSLQVFKTAIAELKEAKAQLKGMAARAKGAQVRLPEQSPLPKAPHVIQWVDRVLDQAIGAAADELSSRLPGNRGTLSRPVAGAVRDAAMLGMAIGHVGLAVRISIIRTLKATACKDLPCNHAGCELLNCKGNHLEQYDEVDMVSEDSDSGSEGTVDGAAALQQVFDVDRVNRKYRLIIPHHKNATRGIAMPPLEVHSHKLNLLLAIWQDLGRHSILGAANRPEGAPVAPELFVSNRGAAFPNLFKWYRDVHFRLHAPYPFISLHKYRNVFVEDRLSNPDRPGPDNEGAAMVMGNTVKQWHDSYWPNKKAKLARDATRSMGKYRRSLLQVAVQKKKVGFARQD